MEVLKLTTENIKELEAGMRYSMLAQYFQDVILLTRALGCKYIWIDALCILQDSREDWIREASRMANVYRNGFLNICAYATDAQHRLLQDRSVTFWSPCLVSESGGELLMAMPDSGQVHLLSSEIFQRGWIFQERLISPRTVYVGDRDCIFECGNSTPLERLPHKWIDIAHGIATKWLLHRYGGMSSSHGTRFEKVWEKIIESYPKTYLTFPSDRLPALSAITALFRDHLGDGYVVGHWSKFFPGNLLWYQAADKKGMYLSPPRVRSPSWSWMPVESAGTSGIHHLGIHNTRTDIASVLGR